MSLNVSYNIEGKNSYLCISACRKSVIYGSGASNALKRRCQYKFFVFVYPYASVKNMGSAAAVLFFLGGGRDCFFFVGTKSRVPGF